MQDSSSAGWDGISTGECCTDASLEIPDAWLRKFTCMGWRVQTHALKSSDAWVGDFRCMCWRVPDAWVGEFRCMGWRVPMHVLESSDAWVANLRFMMDYSDALKMAQPHLNLVIPK